MMPATIVDFCYGWTLFAMKPLQELDEPISGRRVTIAEASA
jgi:hypothetical protein